MWFIVLARMKGEMSKETEDKANKFLANPPPGVKIHNVFYTLGRYDLVIVYEAPTEKDAMACGMFFGGKAFTETLVAVPREEAKELLERLP